MKKLNLVLFGFAVLFSIPSLSDITCTASKREQLPDQSFKTTEAALPVVQGSGNSAIREVTIEDRSFTVTPLQNNDFMVTITVAPDYIHGVLSTLTFTTDGRFALATVDMTTVYKVVCLK